MCTKLELAKLERFTAYRYFIESLQITRDKLAKEYQKTGDQAFQTVIDNLNKEIGEATKNRDLLSIEAGNRQHLRLVS